MRDNNKNPEPCFVDTNIWLYAFIEAQDKNKSVIANALIRDNEITISSQIINEVCVNLIKKVHFPEEDIKELITSFFTKYTVVEINRDIFLRASDLRKKHRFSFWDSLVVSSALYSETDILYSEDMQNGLILENKLKIVNPFA